MSDPIVLFTNGDMNFLAAILNGMAMMFDGGGGHNSIAYMGRIALMLNIFYSIWQGVFKNGMPNIVNILHSIFIYIIFFQALVPVGLYKDTEGYRSISGKLPIGLVYPASVVTRAMHSLSWDLKDSINSGVGVTDSPILQSGLTPLHALLEMRKVRLDGDFSKSGSIAGSVGSVTSGLTTALTHYQDQCITKYALLKDTDVPVDGPTKPNTIFEEATSSNDPLKTLHIAEAGWPFFTTLDNTEINTDCDSGFNIINTALEKKAKDTLLSRMSQLFGLGDSSHTSAELELQAANYLRAMDPMVGAEAVVQMTKNLFVQEVLYGACANAAVLDPSHVQACRGQFDAIQERRFSEAGKADSWREMALPMMTFIEGFVYMLMPVMFFVALIGGQAGFALVFKYMMALLWVALWPVCQVAVDVFLHVYFNIFTENIQTDAAGVGILSSSAFNSTWLQLESFVAFAGTAQAMVPALAMFILYAGVHAMQGLASAASSGGVAPPGTNSANQTAKIDSDNVRYGNQSSTYMRNGDGEHSFHRTGQVAMSTNAAQLNQQYSSSRAVQETLQNVNKEVAQANINAKSTFNDTVSKGFNVGDATAYKVAAANGATVAEGRMMAVNQMLQEKFGDQINIKDAISSGAIASFGGGVKVSTGDLLKFVKAEVGGALDGKAQSVVESVETFVNDKGFQDSVKAAESQMEEAKQTIQKTGSIDELFTKEDKHNTQWGKAVDAALAYQQASTVQAQITEATSNAQNQTIQVGSVANSFASNGSAGKYLTGVDNADAMRSKGFDILERESADRGAMFEDKAKALIASKNPMFEGMSETEVVEQLEGDYQEAMARVKSGGAVTQADFDAIRDAGASQHTIDAVKSTLFNESEGGEGNYVGKSSAQLTSELSGISEADLETAHKDWENWTPSQRTEFVNNYLQGMEQYFAQGSGSPTENQLRSAMTGSAWTAIGRQDYGDYGAFGEDGTLDNAILYGNAIQEGSEKVLDIFNENNFRGLSDDFNNELLMQAAEDGAEGLTKPNPHLDLGRYTGTQHQFQGDIAQAILDRGKDVTDKVDAVRTDSETAIENGQLLSKFRIHDGETILQQWENKSEDIKTLLANASRGALEAYQEEMESWKGVSTARLFGLGSRMEDVVESGHRALAEGEYGEGAFARISDAANELTAFGSLRLDGIRSLVEDRELSDQQLGGVASLIEGKVVSSEDQVKLAASLNNIELSDTDIENMKTAALEKKEFNGELSNGETLTKEQREQLATDIAAISAVNNAQGLIDTKLESLEEEGSGYSKSDIEKAKLMAELAMQNYDVSSEEAFRDSNAEFLADHEEQKGARTQSLEDAYTTKYGIERATDAGARMYAGDQMMAHVGEEHQKIWDEYLKDDSVRGTETFQSYLRRNGGNSGQLNQELIEAGFDAKERSSLQSFRRDVGVRPENMEWHRELAQEIRKNEGQFSIDMVDLESDQYLKSSLNELMNREFFAEKVSLDRIKDGIEVISDKKADLQSVRAAHFDKDNGFTLSREELHAVETSINGKAERLSGSLLYGTSAKKHLENASAKALEAGIIDRNQASNVSSANQLDKDTNHLLRRSDEETREFALTALNNAEANGGKLTDADKNVDALHHSYTSMGDTNKLFEMAMKPEASEGGLGDDVSQEDRVNAVKAMDQAHRYVTAESKFNALEGAASKLTEEQQTLFSQLRNGEVMDLNTKQIDEIKHALVDNGGDVNLVNDLHFTSAEISSSRKAIMSMSPDQQQMAATLIKDYSENGIKIGNPGDGLNDHSREFPNDSRLPTIKKND
ncbi:conjugal transfer protein TraG N-terminal domain-containing protein [Photobacterium sp. ZSDE20]|uniref:Conjugal transfer protein TraG N-terminal domain-containing protein n=1 Tax=Photobacterium pectinilyticum TaxID=2906793 RepID=A0ABT1N102_9GAMM|nr:conjugal transfer protein TraG N-terminal domain-containing protein [Photobacterium sp. ZSDE20]MCQ1058410.1 conjugal transfer protein TraG N-terminal domain-containing protein [Photobacterium sp. ZSDE20]MDD1825227.1 conjugal transfer protein TraG N-terminal domain-containing protein [Photobacterium sp. ZSDE20]